MIAIVTIWHNGKPVRTDKLDALTRKYTSFDSFHSMVWAAGAYRPSIHISGKPKRAQKDLTFLADAYDARQEYEGETKRAYRS